MIRIDYTTFTSKSKSERGLLNTWCCHLVLRKS